MAAINAIQQPEFFQEFIQELDNCLNPPLTGKPVLTTKWMCPNHKEYGTTRGQKRQNPNVVEPVHPELLKDSDMTVDPTSDDSEADSDGSMADDLAREAWKYGGVIYRVRSQMIKRNFIDYAKKYRRNSSHSSNRRHLVLSHKKLPENSIARRITYSELEKLVDVALADVAERPGNTRLMHIEADRYDKCQKLEKLMQRKGKEELMKLLMADE
ncbi:hypothetical protein EC973_005706 [Apophysomyces ossiformis]|uniref:Uncharacterized protein n=1 Tax=Apophysomyces ossiformis TaxID=679940 RepID=A0A8H7EUR4_9FUNG|nr:hypothetical protein EC973_005706 [Apophysomyces ossiformis]